MSPDPLVPSFSTVRSTPSLYDTLSYAYDTTATFGSNYATYLGTEITTAGQRINSTGASFGEFVGDHGSLALSDPFAEAARIKQATVDTAVGLSNAASYAYNNPTKTIYSAGSSAVTYLDRLASDPTVSGNLLGDFTTAWATGGAGAAGKQAVGRGVVAAQKYAKFLRGFDAAVPTGATQSFDVTSTFRNGRFREITLQPGKQLGRAFEEGVNRPVGSFATRGATAKRITSTQSAIDELGLRGTSNVRPNRFGALEVTEPIRVKVGLIEGGGRHAFQYVIDRADLGKLRQVHGSTRILE